MVDLNNETTLDLWKTTLNSYDWDDKNIDYLFPQHQFMVVDQLFTKDKIVPTPGTQIKRQVVYRESGQMQYGSPGDVRTRATGDVVTEMTIPFITSWASHSQIAAEIRRNLGRAQLKRLVDIRRADCKVSMAYSLDVRGFGMPDTSNNQLPYGFPYWLVPITTAQVAAGTGSGAHQGANPSGFSDCGGIDASSSKYSRWRSYNAAWTNADGEITEEDLERMGKMFRRLHYRVPVIVDGGVKQPKATKWRIATNEVIIDGYSRALRKLHDNIGSSDPSRWYGAGMNAAGEPMFKGVMLGWAEPLDTADLTYKGYNPFYLWNADYFFPFVEEGVYFREDAPMRSTEQPDVFTTWVDLAFNFGCTNRQLAGGQICYPSV